MNDQLVPVIDALMKIAVKYPDEEIVIRISGTNIVVGFAKGPYGDKQHDEWGKVVPLLEYQSPQ